MIDSLSCSNNPMLGSIKTYSRITDNGGNTRRKLVPRSKGKSHERIDNLLPKVLGESEDGEHDADGNESEGDFKFLDDLECSTEIHYVVFELIDQLGGESVRPEVGSVADEGDSETDRRGIRKG